MSILNKYKEVSIICIDSNNINKINKYFTLVMIPKEILNYIFLMLEHPVYLVYLSELSKTFYYIIKESKILKDIIEDYKFHYLIEILNCNTEIYLEEVYSEYKIITDDVKHITFTNGKWIKTWNTLRKGYISSLNIRIRRNKNNNYILYRLNKKYLISSRNITYKLLYQKILSFIRLFDKYKRDGLDMEVDYINQDNYITNLNIVWYNSR